MACALLLLYTYGYLCFVTPRSSDCRWYYFLLSKKNFVWQLEQAESKGFQTLFL